MHKNRTEQTFTERHRTVFARFITMEEHWLHNDRLEIKIGLLKLNKFCHEDLEMRQCPLRRRNMLGSSGIDPSISKRNFPKGTRPEHESDDRHFPTCSAIDPENKTADLTFSFFRSGRPSRSPQQGVIANCHNLTNNIRPNTTDRSGSICGEHMFLMRYPLGMATRQNILNKTIKIISSQLSFIAFTA